MAELKDGVKRDDPAEGSVENVNVPSAPETAESGAIEQELLALERRYWQAVKDRDARTAKDLTDDPCILTGAQGVRRVNPETLADMMGSTDYRIDDFYISPDVQVQMLGNDIAVLAYDVHERVTIDGKSITVDAAEASAWVRRGGRWRCALHTESLKGDPFGRDRSAA